MKNYFYLKKKYKEIQVNALTLQTIMIIVRNNTLLELNQRGNFFSDLRIKFIIISFKIKTYQKLK